LDKGRSVAAVVAAAAFVAGTACLVAAEESIHHPTAADEPAVGNPQDYEVLRKLLGLASPEPEQPPVAMPVVSQPAPAFAGPAAAVQNLQERSATAPAVRKAVVRIQPPKPAPHREPPAAPAAVAAAPARALQPEPEPVRLAAAAPAATPADDLPATGTVLRASDIERYQSLFGPSVQWAMLRGATIRVGPHKPIPMEDARAAATQKYHDQVELTSDRRDMRNYVAGLPFPLVDDKDRDAGIKMIFNQQARLVVDDMDARKMGCEIGSLSKHRGFELERTFQIEHWRRLYYLGRMYHAPVPTMPSQDGIRYRELQYPLIEPFDLKGGGWDFIRYSDIGRLDDGWIYYPITRRVRRLSTAQRSQGIFGQDMDLDSYTGYAGNPAWMQWRVVGHKTMLAPMHSDHVPVNWQAPPADFEADEPWEPREVYVLEGRSLLPEYAFARRVIYLDRESWLVTYSEIYDDRGKLWKALHQTWGFGSKVREDAGGRTFEEFYLPGYSMIDMQIDHVTRCELPLRTAVGDKGWYYNYGDAEGTTEKAFDIAGFLGETH
jgi:hypothetical protein